MKGPRNSAVKQLLDDEPRAVSTHCYGPSLNLAISDTVKGCKIIKDCLDLIFELSIKISEVLSKETYIFKN